MYELLVSKAIDAKNNSHSPYSKFRIGAAIIDEDGNIFTGANIENSSFGATCCAERVAIFKAVSEGSKKFKAIAVAGDIQDSIVPCGICRQVLSELCSDDMIVLCCRSNGEYNAYSLGELLPKAFKLKK